MKQTVPLFWVVAARRSSLKINSLNMNKMKLKNKISIKGLELLREIMMLSN